MLSAFLIGLLAIQAQAAADSELTYSAPAGTDQKLVAKAASQMKRRIEDYGYKGVTTRAEKDLVKVSFSTGFTPAMTEAIDRLSKVKGQAYFWAWLQLTEKEYEQWIPGKTSPAGATWLIDGDFKALMDNSLKIPMDMKFERSEPGAFPPVRLSFSREESKKLRERLAKDKIQRGFCIMLDGKPSKLSGRLEHRESGITEWLPAHDVSTMLVSDVDVSAMIAIASPLPIELSRQK